MLRAVGAGGLLLAGGVTGAGAKPRPSDDPVTLFDYDPAAGKFPENVAVDRRGVKYVSFPPLGGVWTVSPDDASEAPYVAFDLGEPQFLTGTIGVEVAPSGTLYVCFVPGPGGDTLGVWEVPRRGEKRLYAELPAGSFPNDIALFDDGLLVTDMFEGRVWRLRRGEATVWADGPLLAPTKTVVPYPVGADGIAVAADGAVYVGNHDQGRVVRIPVGADGSAGQPETFVVDPSLVGIDGMAFDVRGNLYAAINVGNRVVRIAPDGTVETLLTVADGLDGPADVAFGTARGDQRSVYVVNLALGTMENPSLLKLDVGVPGLPLHR